MKTKLFVVFISVFTVCALLFGGIFFVLSRENLIGADVPKTDVPYESASFVPPDTTVLFTFPDGYGAVIELNFSENFIRALLLKDASKQSVKDYGFDIQYTADCDYPFIMDFIDTIGGVELMEKGENYRYTGVQICNLLASFKDDISLKAEILEAVFTKISKSGFSTDALYCIIEDTDTTLSMPSCYGWCENVSGLCKSFNILNER